MYLPDVTVAIPKKVQLEAKRFEPYQASFPSMQEGSKRQCQPEDRTREIGFGNEPDCDRKRTEITIAHRPAEAAIHCFSKDLAAPIPEKRASHGVAVVRVSGSSV